MKPAQTPKQRRQCRVSSEASPQSLGRVFSVLTLLNLVPDQARANTDAGERVQLELDFESISQRDFDLLLRKIAQLTETMYVTEVQKVRSAASAAG